MQLDVEVSPPAFVMAQLELECTCSVPGVYVQYRQLNIDYDFLSSDFLSSLNFGQVTDIQIYRHTEYDAYAQVEPECSQSLPEH